MSSQREAQARRIFGALRKQLGDEYWPCPVNPMLLLDRPDAMHQAVLRLVDALERQHVDRLEALRVERQRIDGLRTMLRALADSNAATSVLLRAEGGA